MLEGKMGSECEAIWHLNLPYQILVEKYAIKITRTWHYKGFSGVFYTLVFRFLGLFFADKNAVYFFCILECQFLEKSRVFLSIFISLILEILESQTTPLPIPSYVKCS